MKDASLPFWKFAPEGTTHYSSGVWLKLEDGKKPMYWYFGGSEWKLFKNDNHYAQMCPEPPTPVPGQSTQDQPVHWFSLVYTGIEVTSGQHATANCYISSSDRTPAFTRKFINDQKKLAKVQGNAVLINIIYLGEMTKDEFLADK